MRDPGDAVTLVERLGLEALPRRRQALLDLVEHEVQPYHGTLQAVGNDSFWCCLVSRWPRRITPDVRCSPGSPCNAPASTLPGPRNADEVAFEVCLGVHTDLSWSAAAPASRSSLQPSWGG